MLTKPALSYSPIAASLSVRTSRKTAPPVGEFQQPREQFATNAPALERGIDSDGVDLVLEWRLPPESRDACVPDELVVRARSDIADVRGSEFPQECLGRPWIVAVEQLRLQLRAARGIARSPVPYR